MEEAKARAFPSFQLNSTVGLEKCAIVWRTEPASSTDQERTAHGNSEEGLLSTTLAKRIRGWI